MNDYLFKGKPVLRTQTNMAASANGYLQAHDTVNQIITALENVTDPLDIKT